VGRRATGSIVTYDGVRDTTYAARFTAYGKRRHVTLGSASEGWSRARAEDELQNILADVRRGRWAPPVSKPEVNEPAEEQTFREFATDWFDQIRRELRPSTATAYRWHLIDHLLPFFQNHRLSEITVAEVDRYRAHKVRESELVAAARARGGTRQRPLSPETINKTIVRLAQILDLAVEYKLIDSNPARGKRRKLKTTKPRRSYLDTTDQIAAMLDAARELDREARPDARHIARRPMLATLTFAGLRLGELRDLRWGRVDLASGWITVAESKTDAGMRRVKIRPALREELLALKAASQRTAPSDYVFGTSNGKAHSQSNIRNRVLAKVVERANERLLAGGELPLPDGLTPHSLRRTFASLLYAIGETPPVVMAEMGHTDPQLALRIYAQAMRRGAKENERLGLLVNGEDLCEETAEIGRSLDRRPPAPLTRSRRGPHGSASGTAS
jgi:integrase